MAKQIERSEAIRLRCQGETIPSIARRLHVSKASVSLWAKGVSIPETALRRMRERAAHNRLLGHEKRRQLTREKLTATKIGAESFVLKQRLTAETALVLSALMYWCEGAKSRNDKEFTFTNADPLAIKGFLGLVRKAFVLDESRFRIKMHLHEYHDERAQRHFWSTVTKIPESQFQNTFWKSHTKKSIKPNYPGCIHVRYHDVTVSRRISAIARAFLQHVA